MIPASYTTETFSDYLQFEVMIELSLQLGWTDLVPAINPTAVVNIIGIGETRAGDGRLTISVTANSATQTILPSQFYIPAGTKVMLGTFQRVVLNAVEVGGTSVTFTTSWNGTKGETGTFYAAPANPRQRNPQYEAIIDETLFRLGVDDITTITGLDNIRKLRHFGRREVWRAVMQNVAGEFSFQTNDQTGGTNFHGVYEQAKSAFQIEDARINSIYAETNPLGLTGGVRAISSTGKVRARW
jgi:hypothetical protein